MSGTADQRVMLLSRERVFYRGWLGQAMQPRRVGAAMVYCAPRGALRIRRGGAWQSVAAAAVPPYAPHELATSDGQIIAACLEPETLCPRALAAFCEAVNAGLHDPAPTLRGAAHRLGPEDMATPARFDARALGHALPARVPDPRIARILDLIEADPAAGPLTAEDCAARIGLSASRFLHLFKEETGVSFRNMRMWKRARRFLEHAAQETSLTEVALDLGYPDSSHFSHSIRKMYGLMPRAIRQGSRGLRVIGGMGAAP